MIGLLIFIGLAVVLVLLGLAMTIPANLSVESSWGATPVIPLTGPQGGPYTVAGPQTATLLSSAARTTGVNSGDQPNYGSKGVILYLNVTVASGTGGLFIHLQGKDPVTGNYATLNSTPTAVTTTGTFAYVYYPGATAAGSGTGGIPLPDTWRVSMAVGDSTSYTYSVGASVLP